MSTSIWWWALTAGTVVLIGSGVAIRRRVYGAARIPRLGFTPPRDVRAPWWAHALLVVGVLLMTLGASRLSDAQGNYFAYFGGAALAALTAQALLVGWHNHRAGDGTGRALHGPTDAG